MHAFLVITQNSKLEIENIKKIINITNFDVIYENLFKISDVKQLIKNTNFKLSKKTVYIIQDFDNASKEAQNAFLKLLEEPQENLIFVLTAKSEEKIIPTVLSRVVIKKFNNNLENYKNNINNNLVNFFEEDINYKFNIIDKIKNRDEAKTFCEDLILIARNNSENLIFLENINNTLNALNANGNANLQLTNMVVNIQ